MPSSLRSAPRGDADTAAGGLVLLADPGDVLLGGAGVDDQAEPVFAEEVDDQVVDHAAFRIQHAGIQGLAGCLQLVDVVGQQAAQEGAGVGAVQVDHAHVGDVEHAGVRPHGIVFFDLRTVVDGHVPAAKVDHLGAGCAVYGIERGRFERHGVKSSDIGIGVGHADCIHMLLAPLCPRYLRDSG
jgi:hypothetical protein